MLEFSRPVWLGLLLVLPAIVWLALRLSYASLGPYQKWLSIGVRIIIWTLLSCALAGVQFVQRSDRVSVVIARDGSDSVDASQLPAVGAALEEARSKMRKDDTLGKVSFAADAYLEYLPMAGVDERRLAEWESELQGNFTDIGEAIQLAVASFPDNAQKRLVLITDGNENIGSAVAEARVARDNGVELYVVDVGTQTGAEVVLASLEAPGRASLGETVNVRFVLDSTVATPAQVTLIRNGEFVDKVPLSVRPGKEVYEFPVRIDQSGFFTYQLVLEPELDTIAENNRAFAFSVVSGQPRLLYATGDSSELRYLPEMLNAHNIRVDVVPPGGIPYNLADFQMYDGVIFSDIAAYDVTDDQMKMVQTLVRDFGRGFMMIGGEKSFGPGGYYETPIEETLPVNMDFRRKRITPSTLVLCLIDKSGSMGATVGGVTKVAMAKEACKAVVSLQTERDYVGVMGFDAVGQWVVQPTRGINKEETLAKISAMQAGGGTDLYPALKAAYEESQRLSVQIRHVIVFTDGIVAPADFQGLVNQMKADGFTISTVAFGTDADVPFLQQLAAMGEGNMYEANSLHDLPKIFTREVFLANKATLTEEPFNARPTGDHPLVSGIGWSSAPMLYGYVATSPKDAAQVPLLTHKDDPLLAIWRYGLGKSAAFTSDAKNRWARQWLDWRGYEKFWTGVARWIRSDLDTSGVDVVASLSGHEGVIQVSAVDEGGEFVNYGQLEARITSPDLETQALRLDQVGPGQYEGRFPVRQNGNYFINVIQLTEDEAGNAAPVGAQASGLSVSYSPEYKSLEPNTFLLNHLRSSSLAPEGVTLGGLFTDQRRPQRRLENAWELFTLVALLLWLFDVAVRRLVIDWREWRTALVGVLEGAGGVRARRASESLAGLLAVKARGRERLLPREPSAVEAHRSRLGSEAQAREQASGKTASMSPESPVGEVRAPAQQSRAAGQASALSGLRQRMAEREEQRRRGGAALRRGGEAGSQAPSPSTRGTAERADGDISAREMTSRLLERKRRRRSPDSSKDDS